MQYLVVSDLHANLEAFEAVLAAAPACDHVLVLGDLVGYGADPNAIVDRVRAFATATVIRGNHDKVAAGLEPATGFNHLARRAVEWTQAALTPANRDWIAALPPGPVLVDELIEVCHGSPVDEDVYLFDDMDARQAFRAIRRPLCLFGHTHVPTVFIDGEVPKFVGPPYGPRYDVRMADGARYVVNCGAVGQPRDGDPRAAYGVVDTAARTVSVLRVRYDVGAAQAKILAAGLPEVLAQRLGTGR